METIQISLEFTPNPNTLKFVVNTRFMDRGAANFLSAGDALGKSPLAEELFKVPGVSAVMIGPSFITITKATSGDWDIVAEQVPQTVEKHLKASLPVFSNQYDPMASVANSSKPEDQEIEKKIREILDTEIRPAVAMDGGDITFGKFENGIVYLSLQGSCSSCPSSTATLKIGVETRLKELIPEVKEVVPF